MKYLVHSVCLLCFSAFAASGLAQQRASDLGALPLMRGALVSVALVDLVTGEQLDAHRPDDRLCPASVWKIMTASAAIAQLGPDFKFRTTLVYQGSIEGKVLHGDVVIVGGGDPSLGSGRTGPGMDAVLRDWVAAIRALGVDSITGHVAANAAHFQGDGIPRTRIWEDMANYYGAATSGLNFNDNTYQVRFTTPAEIGLSAKVLEVFPEVPGLVLSSEVVSSTAQMDLAYIFGAPGTAERTVRGSLPAGRHSFAVKGSLPDPPLFAAFHLHHQLLVSGIKVGGTFKAEHHELREPPLVKKIAEYQSPPLSALVRHMLVESDNLFAETFLFQMGARSGVPTLEGGLKALNAHYAGEGRGGNPSFFGYDGSGLSRFNAVSAAQVTSVLAKARSNEPMRKHVLQVLPLAGKEGTVKYFGKNTNLDGNMRVKSGSMDKVRAYAGTFLAYTGRELGFAVIINNYDGDSVEVRKAIESWLVAAYGAY